MPGSRKDSPRPRCRVCVVCADRGVARSLAAVLDAYDVECKVVDAPDRIGPAEADALDCVIVDMMSRFARTPASVCRIAEETDDLPVILLNGTVAASLRERMAKHFSQVAVLHSPVDGDELIEALAQVGALKH